MTTKEINIFFLGINDLIKIKVPGYCYLQFQKDGRHYFEDAFNYKDIDGWISCPELVGTYCGENCNIDTGEIETFKFRVSKPFKMSQFYNNYLSLSPSMITSMVIIKKERRTVYDTLFNTLTIKDLFQKN